MLYVQLLFNLNVNIMNKNSTSKYAMTAAEQLELMEAVVTNTPEAFETLCARFRPLIFSTIYRVLNNSLDTDDVAQEVLLTIWKKSSSWDPSKGSLSTWIASIARNRAIDLIRKKNRRSEHQKKYQEQNSIESSRYEESACEQLLQTEAQRITRNAVVELSPEQREVIELAYFQGLTQVEVSKRVGLPLGTAKARIRRGVKKLREKVPGSLIIQGDQFQERATFAS
jgi:RNA polymerase sigma-70 factor (ECF subfamily)